MQTDPTLDVNLTRALEESKRLADSIKPGTDQWDVIVVGSGAAGGMAAFQLAMAGVKVLLLEAGRMIDVRTEYRTMEWPYASMRRQRLPADEREHVRRDVCDGDALRRRRVVAQRRGTRGVGGERLDGGGARAGEVGELPQRERLRPAPARAVRHINQAVHAGERQPAYADRVDDGEERVVGADAEREGEHGDAREAAVPGEKPRGEAHVLPDLVNGHGCLRPFHTPGPAPRASGAPRSRTERI